MSPEQFVQTYFLSYYFGSFASLACVVHDDLTLRFLFSPGGGWALALFTVQPVFGVGMNAFPILVLATLKFLRSPQR